MPLFDPQIVATFALTTGVGAAMVWLAARFKTLEVRPSHERCPACGVLVKRGDRCRCCA